MRGVVADEPGAVGARTRHHVEVVEVVAGRRDGGPVVAVRHERDVARAHDGVDRDLARGRRRGVEQAEGIRVRGRVQPATDGGLEVVDLLPPRRLPRLVLVVLVRRVARPVLGGRQHLADDEALGVEGSGRAGGPEVVHLAARAAGTAQLDGHVLAGDPVARHGPRRRRLGDGHAAGSGEHRARVARQVEHVGRPGEDRRAALEVGHALVAVGLPLPHGEGSRERHHHALDARCGQLERVALGEHRDPEARVLPVGEGSVDHGLPAVPAQGPAGVQPLVRRHARLLRRGRMPGRAVVVRISSAGSRGRLRRATGRASGW